MIEHEYVECTSSVIQALVLFKKLYPGHRKMEIDNFVTNAVRYLEDTQLPDGSWYFFTLSSPPLSFVVVIFSKRYLNHLK